MSRPRRIAFSVGLVLATLLAIALIVPAITSMRDAARNQDTRNNFKMVCNGLIYFNDTFGTLPHAVRFPSIGDDRKDHFYPQAMDPAGPALSSWRYCIINFSTGFGGGSSEKPRPTYNEPWDSEANSRAANWIPVYRYDDSTDDANIFAITGPDTAFGIIEPRSLKDLDPDTIIAAEIAHSGLHWKAPGDFDIRTLPHTINDPSGKGISSRNPIGFNVVFADGAIWFLRNDVPFDLLERFLTVSGAKNNDREELLSPYRYK